MGEVKDFIVSTLYVWAFAVGALLATAWFGLPLWALLYFIYWVL